MSHTKLWEAGDRSPGEAPPGSTPSIPVGTTVRIDGLSMTEYNGLVGTVVSPLNARNRQGVQINGKPKTLALKTMNLTVVNGGDGGPAVFPTPYKAEKGSGAVGNQRIPHARMDDGGADAAPDQPLLSGELARLVSPEGVVIHVIGTAHISRKSVVDAQLAVRTRRPGLVFVELCTKRQGMLNLPLDRPIEKAEFTASEVQRVLNNGEGYAGVMTLALSAFTWQAAEQIGLEITPGTEFAAAAQEAASYGGRTVLGDRDVNVTLKRSWRALGVWERCKLTYQLLMEDLSELTADKIEEMRDTVCFFILFCLIARHRRINSSRNPI